MNVEKEKPRRQAPLIDTGTQELEPPHCIVKTSGTPCTSSAKATSATSAAAEPGLQAQRSAGTDSGTNSTLPRDDFEARTMDDGSFEWFVAPPTRLTPAQVGQGRTVSPGAFEVILRQPSCNIHSISGDTAVEDETMEAPSEWPHLTSATLVDQDRERQLELENELLRKKVEQQSSTTVAIPILDDEHEKESQTSLPCFRKKTLLGLIVLVALCGVFTVLWTRVLNMDSSKPSRPLTTAMDLIGNETSLSTFAKYLESTGLADKMRSNTWGPLTVLAPTNDTFAAYLPKQYRYQDPRGVIHMRALLSKHIFAGAVLHISMMDGVIVETISNETLQISAEERFKGDELDVSFTPALEASRVNITKIDMVAENGDVIHMIDGLLKPNFYDLTVYDLAVKLNLTSILGWGKRVGLDPILKMKEDFTILFPTNEAEADMPPQVRELAEKDDSFVVAVIFTHAIRMLYPVEKLEKDDLGVPTMHGEASINFHEHNRQISVSLDNGAAANVTLADQIARNGMIQVLDSILVPTHP